MRIDAYRNLNKPNVTYSIRHRGRVVDYAHNVTIAGATAKHATAKQLARVRSGVREVCQWFKGERVDSAPAGLNWKRLCGNPKTADGIVDVETGERVDSADFVQLRDDGSAWYANQA